MLRTIFKTLGIISLSVFVFSIMLLLLNLQCHKLIVLSFIVSVILALLSALTMIIMMFIEEGKEDE